MLYLKRLPFRYARVGGALHVVLLTVRAGQPDKGYQFANSIVYCAYSLVPVKDAPADPIGTCLARTNRPSTSPARSITASPPPEPITATAPSAGPRFPAPSPPARATPAPSGSRARRASPAPAPGTCCAPGCPRRRGTPPPPRPRRPGTAPPPAPRPAPGGC